MGIKNKYGICKSRYRYLHFLFDCYAIQTFEKVLSIVIKFCCNCPLPFTYQGSFFHQKIIRIHVYTDTCTIPKYSHTCADTHVDCSCIHQHLKKWNSIWKYTVAHNCHVKSKTLASKAKRSRQKQNARVKSKTIASKANYTGLKSKTIASKAKSWRQKQNGRVKSKTVASKAKESRQKPNARVKSKTVASKAKCIRALVATDEQKHSENLLIVKLLLRH